MEESLKKKMLELVGNNIRFDFPMSRYSTIRAGGPVDAFFVAENQYLLKKMLAFLKEKNVPYIVIGRCSNILVTDRGFKGVAIVLGKGFSWIEQQSENHVCAGAGLNISGLIEFCKNRGLMGLEFLCGIPGSVGGAVSMNAGAYGKEIGEMLVELELINSSGNTETLRKDDLVFEYRRALIPTGSIITKASFHVNKTNPGDVSKRIYFLLEKRKKEQPLDKPSCGSIFKNPPGNYAGKLIEDAGLKGFRFGDALISPKHANFILNTGSAKAGDILRLIDFIKEKVRDRTGIELECEIKIIGD